MTASLPTGDLLGSLTISPSGITAEPCGFLAIFYFAVELPPNLLKWNHAGLDWRRIGLAQDKAILCRSHLKFESSARRELGAERLLLYPCLQKCLFKAKIV